MQAILLGIKDCNDKIVAHALRSGSLDRILEEGLVQKQRIGKLKAELSREWHVIKAREREA